MTLDDVAVHVLIAAVYRRFPDSHFPGKTFPEKHVSRWMELFKKQKTSLYFSELRCQYDEHKVEHGPVVNVL